MKHFFYFKKGSGVPQWLLRVLNSESGDIVNCAKFKANGKVMVDDATGKSLIWPASKRFSCLIVIDGGGLSLSVDAGGFDCENVMYCFKGRRSPLSVARSHGHDVMTTTKCIRIPDEFKRVAN